MSDSQGEPEKKEEESAQQKKAGQSATSQTQTEAQTTTPTGTKPTAPRVGTPRPQIGTPIGKPPSEQSVTARPQVDSTTAANATTQRPQVGTPSGTRPVVGTPVGTPRLTVGTPVGTPKPAPVGAPSAAKPPTGATAPPRPAVASPAKPSAPSKPVESKQEISRRNFIKGLAIVGGIIAVGQFAALGPYLQGSVGTSKITTQVINDATTGKPIKTTDVAENGWTTFVYPRTGDPNIDNDTFRQMVLIHLPKGWTTTDTTYSAKDPISGDHFVALSRVCVHLWCLWSYVGVDHRGECPCHGSQYLPGGLPNSEGANNPGIAVAGPAYLQTPPNNQLPLVTISIASDGTVSATGVVGQIGCGQKC